MLLLDGMSGGINAKLRFRSVSSTIMARVWQPCPISTVVLSISYGQHSGITSRVTLACMSINRIPVHFSDRRRRAIDQFVRRIVTACGVGILLLMLLLFFWLIWVVMPLFSAPGMQPTLSQQLGTKPRRWRWQRRPARLAHQPQRSALYSARRPASGRRAGAERPAAGGDQQRRQQRIAQYAGRSVADATAHPRPAR